MKYVSTKLKAIASLALLTGSTAHGQNAPEEFKGVIGKTIAESKESWPENPKAPTGAPNVVWILLDDVGYGASSAFGGLIETPNLERLANQGLRYTNWHTCAYSAPTRAALLTGCNSHSVHFGFFASSPYGTPGYDGYLPFEHATIAEILRENGYNTFAVGKYHLTSPSDISGAGPFNRWPTGRGFDHFYGYSPDAGEGDQWNPTVYRDTQLEPKDPQGRHFGELITNEAIRYISDQKKADPNKPFFLYYAPGAAHAPHQVAKEWIDKYKGKFDKGWDWYREEVLKQQIKLGVVPSTTKLAPQNPNAKSWNKLTDDEKRLFARYMETYAGFLSYTDEQIGRITTELERLGQLDNTLIVLMIGDNGAAEMGGEYGQVFMKNRGKKQTKEAFENELTYIDKIGSAETSPFYPLGWAAATNTPFRYYKGNPCWEGGTHDPLIVYYPKKIKDAGGIRDQYSYVNDILPTTLELVGVSAPAVINGYQQKPAEGVSLAYSIENKDASEQHTVQYNEMTGSFSIYKDGWKVNFPNGLTNRALDSTAVYLYNTKKDFNETVDLSKKNPEKVKELLTLFDEEAWKYNVYPLKNKWKNTNPNLKKRNDE
jgi:arylsulfatase A-like enzyme